MRPAEDSDISRALVWLHVKTIRRAEGDLDLEAALECYLAELRRYPADLALNAVSSWRGKFFPALQELRDAIEGHEIYRQRVQRIRALEAFLAGYDAPKDARRPTAEQHARVAEYVRQSRANGGDDQSGQDMAAFFQKANETCRRLAEKWKDARR